MKVDQLNDERLSELDVRADGRTDNDLLVLKARPGVPVDRAVEHAIQAADDLRVELRLLFNGASVRVSPFSSAQDVLQDWRRAHQNA